MPLIPLRETRTSRRPQLDQALVVKAALSLLDEAGLDELTMRRLAAKLGVKAASLYRHVRNKEQLLALLADEICGEIPLTDGRGDWRKRLREAAWNVRRGLLAHRDAARVFAESAPFGPRRLRHIESVLDILRSAGLSPGDAASAAIFCNNFITEFVADEARFTAMAAASGESRRKMLAGVRKLFKALPANAFPNIAEMADHLAADEPDRQFEFGMDLILRGLEALCRPASRAK